MKKQSAFSLSIKEKERIGAENARKQEKEKKEKLKKIRLEQLGSLNRIKILLEKMESALSECENDVLPFLIKNKKQIPVLSKYYGSNQRKDVIIVELGHEELIVETSGKDMMDEWVTDERLLHECYLFVILECDNLPRKGKRISFFSSCYNDRYIFLLTLSGTEELILKTKRSKNDHSFYEHYQQNGSLQKLLSFFETIAKDSDEFQKFLADKFF